jgi:Family of unknown function (DUF6428)
MHLNELKTILRSHPSACPRFTFPDGNQIPTHFHITEVGHVTRRFVDCGGVLHDRSDTCLIQTWLGEDLNHRLTAGRFAKILDLGAQLLPSEDVPVEVEYDCCVVAQYPIESVQRKGNVLELKLADKHTDCLSRRRRKIDGGCCTKQVEAHAATATSCC